MLTLYCAGTMEKNKMNEKIKEVMSLIQTLIIGWIALYGTLNLTGLTLPYGYTPFSAATGLWFASIAWGFVAATIQAVYVNVVGEETR